MAITRIQTKRASGASNPLVLTLDSAPQSGNVLIIAVGVNYSAPLADVSSIAQTNVTWTKQKQQKVSGELNIEIWAGVVSGTGGTTVTVNLTATPQFGIVADICEYSGLLTSGFLDQTASSYSTSATNVVTGTTETTTQDVELWVGAAVTWTYAGDYSLTDPQSGFTLLDGEAEKLGISGWTCVAYLEKIVSATGQAASGVTAPFVVHYQACIVTLKGSGAVLKEVTDTLSLADTLLVNKTLTVSDSLGLADSLLRDKPLTQVLDVLSLSDAVLIDKVLSVTDLLSLADQVTVDTGVTLQEVLDSLTLGDIIAVSKSLTTVSDTLTLQDIVERLGEVLLGKTKLDKAKLDKTKTDKV